MKSTRSWMLACACLISASFLLTGCAPGLMTLLFQTIANFRQAGCQGLPPEKRPSLPENNGNGVRPCTPEPIRVMTYNVLCSICIDKGLDGWDQRLPFLQGFLKEYDADLVGLEELATAQEAAQVIKGTSGYAILTYAPGILNYADSTILYKVKRFELQESGHFWLGPLPCKPSLPGWETEAMLRFVVWARLRDRATGFEFLFVCSHLDPGHTNRDMAAKVITEWLAPVQQQLPMVFVGDFNAKPDTEGYLTLQGGNGSPMRFENTFDYAKTRVARTNTTENDLSANPVGYLADVIDHIMYAGPQDTQVTKWVRDERTFGPNNLPPSDHYPVIADIQFTLK